MGEVKQLKQEEPSSKRARKAASEFDEGFEWFWSEYPVHKARRDAERAWRATEAHRPDTEVLIAALNSQMKSDAWTRDGGRFIPYPATWLNGARWEDE